jgi:hypothetical protein
MTGFEPATFRSQSGRATKLRHIPCRPGTKPPGAPASLEDRRARARNPPSQAWRQNGLTASARDTMGGATDAIRRTRGADGGAAGCHAGVAQW